METTTKTIDINAYITDLKYEITVQNNEAVAIISFKNLYYGIITAIKFNAVGYNSFGDIAQVNGSDNFFLIIQDISVEKNKTINGIKVTLPNKDIRKLELEENQICFSDGSVETYKGKEECTVEFEDFDRNVAEAVSSEYNSQYVYWYKPKEFSQGWLCACGCINRSTNNKCQLCGIDKERVFLLADDDAVKNITEKYFEEKKEKEKKEKEERLQKEEEEKELQKKKKKRNYMIVAGIIIACIIALAAFNLYQFSLRKTYSSAEEMQEDLQGTYTYYENGSAQKQLVLEDDNATLKFQYSTTADIESEVEWNYKRGTFKTFKTYTVLKNGTIKSEDEIYHPGGTMTQNSSFWSFSSNSSSSNSSSSTENAKSVLKISDVKVSSNSSYTICTGTITNNGQKTYKFVQVKGAFEDQSGNVLDTDSSYAVGSEGLAPDESSTFRMSVKKNTDITDCSVSIYEYKE